MNSPQFPQHYPSQYHVCRKSLNCYGNDYSDADIPDSVVNHSKKIVIDPDRMDFVNGKVLNI